MGGISQIDEIRQIISLALLVFVSLLVIVGATKGYSRGIKRQSVRTVTIIISVILSFVAVNILYSKLLGFFDGMTMQDLFAKMEELNMGLDQETKDAMASFDPVIFEYILAIPLALFVGPFAFGLAFVVISGVMWLIHGIVCGIVGFRKQENNWITRLLGMVLGFVQGALVSVVLLVPVIGLASTMSGAVETIRANENKSEIEVELIDMYDNNVKEIVEDPMLVLLGKLGGNVIYDNITTVEVDGNDIEMGAQIDTVLVIVNEINTFTGEDFDFTKLNADQQESLKTVINAIGDSNYFAPLLSKFMNGMGTLMEKEVTGEMEEPVKTLMTEVFGLFKTASQENIKADLNTIFDFFFLLTNEGVLDAAIGSEDPNAPDVDIMDVLFKEDAEGKTTVDRAIVILDSNPRTSAIVSSLVKLSVAYAKESLKESVDGMPELEGAEIDEIYASVKQSVDAIVAMKPTDYADDAAYKAAVADSIENFVLDTGFVNQTTIDENREEMDEIFAEVSEFVIAEFEGKDSVSDAELIRIVFQYYNSYENGEFGSSNAGDEPIPQQ